MLYSQFAGQPRNEDGGFWHEKDISASDVAGRTLYGSSIFMQNMLSVIIARRIMQTS